MNVKAFSNYLKCKLQKKSIKGRMIMQVSKQKYNQGTIVTILKLQHSANCRSLHKCFYRIDHCNKENCIMYSYTTSLLQLFLSAHSNQNLLYNLEYNYQCHTILRGPIGQNQDLEKIAINEQLSLCPDSICLQYVFGLLSARSTDMKGIHFCTI